MLFTHLRALGALAALCLVFLASPPGGAASAASPAPPSFLSRLEPPGPRYTGTVIEEVPAGGYRYLRLAQPDTDDRWVVSLDHGSLLGRVVAVRPFGTSRDFVSHRTGRRFPTLDFATVQPQESP